MIASLPTSQKLDKNKSKTKLGTQTRLKSMKIEGKKKVVKIFKRFHKRPERNENRGCLKKKL